MNTQPILIRETSSPTELAKLAVDAVTRGDVDPLVAYENISRMEKAIELFKKSEEVRDITLRELAKYGHGKTSSDCTIEEVEAGVKYDYSGAAGLRPDGSRHGRNLLSSCTKQQDDA